MSIRGLMKWGVPTLARFRRSQASPRDQFDDVVRDFLRPDHMVLEAGCGRRTSTMMRQSGCIVVGVDTDEYIAENAGVDVPIRADLGRLPFRDGVFDVTISWWVLEHLEDPQACLAELARVSKDGAIAVHGTPNVLHYASLFAALTPFWFHKWFRAFALGDRHAAFPTRYRANTPRQMRKLMKAAGFVPVEVRCIDSGPGYFRWFTPLYAMGLVYHRMVSCFGWLAYFRDSIIGVFRRAHTGGAGLKG